MQDNSHTLIVWGAGATAGLGMRTTVQQSNFLIELAGDEETESPASCLRSRVIDAVGETDGVWHSALVDLLVVLGDANEVNDITRITPEQLSVMRDNWKSDADEEELRDRILSLRMLYDWIALKFIINVLHPKSGKVQSSTNFLTDLINILDIHSASGHGFRLQENEFLTPARIVGARNAMKMLLLTMFFIDWNTLRSDPGKKRELKQYYEFALAVGKRIQRQGVLLAEEIDHESYEFYMANISVASLNYDPIAIWLQIIANRNLNKSPSVPRVGPSVLRLQMYHDFAHSVPSVRIGGGRRGSRRMSMTESAAQRINDPEHGATDRIRLSKFLFLHGCTNWRECPNCGKLTAFMSDGWEPDSSTLFPIPPLKAFAKHLNPGDRLDKELIEYEKGNVDVRACVHCENLTYLHHTQIVMQSNFKSQPPPFIQEIQRDFRVVVGNSDHIIFMGYSLPPDDVDYRAIFAVRRHRDPSRKLKCSVVVGKNWKLCHWLMPSDLSNLDALDLKSDHRQTLEAAQNLFGKENVRFYGGGIPQVFLEGEVVSESAIEQLLYWESTE